MPVIYSDTFYKIKQIIIKAFEVFPEHLLLGILYISIYILFKYKIEKIQKNVIIVLLFCCCENIY